MSVFRTVVCPTDLSPDGDAALAAAAALAGAEGARLVALHCLTGPDAPAASEERATRAAIAGVWGRWEKLVATGGRVSETIVREAAALGADLVVLRSRRRPLSSSLLGSTVESVCRTAPCPVLVVRPDQEVEGPPKRIVVAYDFWDDSELALRHALVAAERHGAEVHVLHVVPAPLRWAADVDLDRRIAEVERRLVGAVPDAVRRRVRVSTGVLLGSPYREILTYAEERRADLICLGARGRDFGARSLFGSNSDRILRQAPCPVLIARPLRPALRHAERASAAPTSAPARTPAREPF